MNSVDNSNVSDIPYDYKLIIRKCLDIIKLDLGLLSEYESKILNMIATNKTLYYKHGYYIELNDKSFEKNFKYVLNNIKDFYNIVSSTFLNGEIGELIVGNILKNELKLKVIEPTVNENIQGADIISVGNNRFWHQVKFIYDYDEYEIDMCKYISIKNKFLDIKNSDKYDYLWFYVNNKKESLLLKNEDIDIQKIENNYIIKYTKIQKYNISENVYNTFKEIAYNNIVINFFDKIDTKYDTILNIFNKNH